MNEVCCIALLYSQEISTVSQVCKLMSAEYYRDEALGTRSAVASKELIAIPHEASPNSGHPPVSLTMMSSVVIYHLLVCQLLVVFAYYI